MASLITKASVIENSAALLLARVIGADGNPVQQADINAITLKVFDAGGVLVTPSGGGGGYTSTPLDPADVILDTPATNEALWPYDDGYNFIVQLDGSYWPVGGVTYQAEVKVEPVDGEAYYLLYWLTTTNIYSE
jgi:hypothetical protein